LEKKEKYLILYNEGEGKGRGAPVRYFSEHLQWQKKETICEKKSEKLS
jgi:hypothetical protein